MAKRALILVTSHAAALLVGLAAGIYVLPVIVAPPPGTAAELAAHQRQALFTGHFRRSLRDSDILHWGVGAISIGATSISLEGPLAPGPDYKLYLSPEFVETERDFARLKPRMVRVGDVRGFTGVLLPVPDGIDVRSYNTAIVWCESFSQFITAAQYR